MTGMPVAVKICGLTTLEDARHAWRCGADLLGFVLVPDTPRYVTPETAGTLVRALREEGCEATLVGVVAYAPADRGAQSVRALQPRPAKDCTGRTLSGPPGRTQQERPTEAAGSGAGHSVATIAAGCGFDVVQIHGDPPADVVARLGMPTLVARRVRGAIDWIALAAYGAWGYVLDGYQPDRLGGTGQAWDWRLASGRPEGFGRTLIAGGLTPDNVAEAIRLAAPWGVDVSSGVESAPGRKDPRAVAQFIERAKGV